MMTIKPVAGHEGEWLVVDTHGDLGASVYYVTTDEVRGKIVRRVRDRSGKLINRHAVVYTRVLAAITETSDTNEGLNR